MIDAHIHLDQYPKEQLPQLIDEWQSNGIEGVVAVATDLRSSYNTLELSAQFPHFVFPCIGWHPEQRLPTEHETLELFDLIKKEKDHIAGIGEIGLPYYALEQLGNPPLEPYTELFSAFVKEATTHELPVNIHAVYEGAAVAFHILQQKCAKKAHFHWLKTDIDIIKNIIGSGYYISLTPEVCYRERDIPLLVNTPVEQLLVETDGPWEFAGPFSGRMTTPLFIKDSLKIIAQFKNDRIEKLMHQVYMNSVMLYDSIKSCKGG